MKYKDFYNNFKEYTVKNWDGEDAFPISEKTIERAYKLFLTLDDVAFDFYPLCNGKIGFCKKVKEIGDIVLSIDEDGIICGGFVMECE